MSQVLIIGAGLSGLSAANQLVKDGHTITVVDKGRGIGGRMATRRFAGGVFDHGAQFFTVRSDELRGELDKWREKGVASHWFDGYPSPDNRKPNDSHPRFRGESGMTGIAKFMAEGLDVRLNTEIVSLKREGGLWTGTTASGESFSGDKLLLTAPVPQSLALLASSGEVLPNEARETLQSLSFEPCFALLVQLSQPSAIPAPGLYYVEGEPIYWISDNFQKGISPIPGSVTIHSSAAFAQAHYDDDENNVAASLLEAAKSYLGSEPTQWQLRRWRYSKPANSAQLGAVWVPELAVCFAGDALNGAKVEGAFLSGLKAAEFLNTDERG